MDYGNDQWAVTLAYNTGMHSIHLAKHVLIDLINCNSTYVQVPYLPTRRSLNHASHKGLQGISGTLEDSSIAKSHDS